MSETNSILDFSVNKKAIQESAFKSIIIQIIFKLKGFITVPIMTHYLLPREMGIYNLIVVTAYLLYPLFSLNLIPGPSVYLIQEKSKERIRKMYYTSINSSILFYILFTLLLWLGMLRFGGKYYRYFFVMLPLLYSILIYYVFACVLIFYQKLTILLKIQIIKDAISILLVIALVIAGYSYYGMIFAAAISDIIAGIYIYLLIKKELPYRFFIDKNILWLFIKISLPLLPIYFFNWIIQSSNSYFLVHFKGEDAVGKFSVVFGLSNIILVFDQALKMFWNSVSAKLWVENREKYQKIFQSAFFVILSFLFLAVLLFEFNSKIITQLVIRRSDYYDAYVIFGVVAFAFAMQVLITMLMAPLYSNRNPKIILLSFLIGSVISVFLNFIMIPAHGIIGAAISMALSHFSIVVILVFFNYSVLKFAFIDKRIFVMGISFVILWIGVINLREQFGIERIVIGSAILVVILGIGLFCFVLKKDEKGLVISVVKDLKTKLKIKQK